MTDQEIVKALECCFKGDKAQCSSCAYYPRGFVTCWQTAGQDAFDLINRQHAKIAKQKERCSKCGEKTTKTILNLQELLGEQKAEIERLKREIPYVSDLGEMYSEIRAEAVKEFAEQVKLEFYREFDEIIPSIMADKIDNLVKEMEK